MAVKDSKTLNELSRAPRLWAQVARWLLGRPSILSLSPSLIHYFWQSKPGLSRPDLQGVFTPASYRAGYVGVLDEFPGMTCGVWAHRPYSRGSVRLRSADPLADPLIQPNYLADPRDCETLLGGMRLARRLLQTPELAPFAAGETMPGPQVQSDDEMLDYARRFGVSSYHVNGTARMGLASDTMAVVDEPVARAWPARAARGGRVGHAEHSVGQYLRRNDDDCGEGGGHDQGVGQSRPKSLTRRGGRRH